MVLLEYVHFAPSVGSHLSGTKTEGVVPIMGVWFQHSEMFSKV